MSLALRSTLAAAVLMASVVPPSASACCAVARSGKPVVNADQTVIIIWDKKNKTQHFIRKPSFKTDVSDFGFIVPTPSKPELAESGDDAFPYLRKVTEPEKKARPSGGMGCSIGCSKAKTAKTMAKEGPKVRVLEEKEVAGFKTTVLEADDSKALVDWLKENGFAFSPAVQEWAEPYIKQKWKFTALKAAKKGDTKGKKDVKLDALRLTFKTDRPLFPYREPRSADAAKTLNADSRLLRIYFIAEARYAGELTKEHGWSGNAAWANKLTAEQRAKLLDLLKLPKSTGPDEFFLTEFEDNWEYKQAPADVHFAKADEQSELKRRPIYTSGTWSHDVTLYALVGVFLIPSLTRRRRKTDKAANN